MSYQNDLERKFDDDAFMKSFKYYKSNKPKPSLNAVLCYYQEYPSNQADIVPVVSNSILEDPRTRFLGLKTTQEWQTFYFSKHPGLILIKNPFTSLGQRYWIRKCLEVYPRKPNKLNIDIELDLNDWWQECFKNGECNKQLMKKLRWTTLGYHHNWETKVYTEENKTPFPEDLAELSDVIANFLGYTSFRAEAAIINYYHMNSTLSGHTDHSEVNLEAPLLSFSFGQSAIFLLGGKEKTVEPSAILLSSGDIIVMSKEARLCYHAVPKILPASNFNWDDNVLSINNNDIPPFKYLSDPEACIVSMNNNVDYVKWSKYDNYVQESRINMNVRQVLNENQEYLMECFIDS